MAHKGLIIAAAALAASIAMTSCRQEEEKEKEYLEIRYPTQNYDRELANDVQGIILHHTALPTLQRSLETLTLRRNIVSTHCVIDTDGTRYILASPETVTYHAGKSILHDREKCNEFCIGVEFQGNTVEQPLTDDQINSAVQYLRPIIKKYGIPYSNIVTHAHVRDNYLRANPQSRVKDKVDITPPEYDRVMKALRGQ